MEQSDTVVLVSALSRHGLLEPAQLETVRSQLQPSLADPGPLVDELIRRGWLTRYQAGLLLQGRAEELILGSYVLLEPLGEGGMGQVFKARQRKLGRIDAVKVIRGDRLFSPDALNRFQREMRAAATLSHPNVVQAYYADEDKGRHYFAMELLAGSDLAHLVRMNGPLPFAEACEYIRQAALGLQHAHERGLVHRDVKPQNLLLTPEGIVKVLDLGLALVGTQTDSGEGTLTQPGAVMGTPDYIAPEQARQSHTVDGRADLYSLGCTLYFLLTGQPPFPNGPMAAKVAGHLFEEPEPVEQLRPGTPPSLAAAVRRLMAKKPEERFASAGELATTLERIGDGLADTAAAGTGLWPEGTPIGAPPGRRRGRAWLYATLGILLVIGGAVLVWMLRPPLTPRGGKPAAAAATTPTPPTPPPAQGAILFDADARSLRLIARRKDRPDDAHEAKPGEPLSLDVGDYELELGPEAPAGLRLASREVTLAAGAQATVRMENYPVSGHALVSRPAPIDGVRSWTITSRQGRGAVTHLAYSPGGQWLAETHEDDAVRLLTPTGQFERVFVMPGAGIRALAWRPLVSDDADAVLAVLSETDVRAWSAATGRLVFDLRIPANALAWSADGKTVATASSSGVQLWDAATGQEIVGPSQPDQTLQRLAWSPDGKILAGAGDDGAVHLWRPPEWTEEVRKEHAGPVVGLAWSPDSSLLASASRDGVIHRWPAAPGAAPLAPIRTGKMDLRALTWIPDKAGPKIASCGEVGPDEPSVQLWNGLTGQPLPPPAIKGGQLLTLSPSPDGRTLACGSLDKTTFYWDLINEKLRATIVAPDGDALGAAAWAPDGKLVATDGWGRSVFVWAMSGELVRRAATPLQAQVTGTSWSRGAKQLAYIYGGDPYVWPSGEVAPFLLKTDGGPRLTAWSPHATANMNLLAVACDDRRIRVWHIHGRTLRTTLDAGANQIAALAWAPEEPYLAAGDEGGDVYLWREEGANWPRPRKWTHPGKVHSLAWSPDGKTLAASFSDGSVAMWDRDAGKSLGDLSGPKGAGGPAVWSPDGKTLLVLGDDGVLRFWNVETKELLRQVRGPARGAAFSSDAALLAGVSKTYTVRLWETATGRPLGTGVRLEHGWVVLSETGHYRCENGDVEKELVYVVQTDEGQQMLSPKQFAEQYHWKNNPDAARLDTR